MNNKKRLDVAITELGLAPSREKARALIMAGQVYVNQQKSDKAGNQVKETDKIEVRGNPLPFVSRGGLKLQKAIKSFGLELKDTVCMDIGASTGGFTDCMLQHGAKKVFAIDVGYGQLAWKLRTNERVVNLERTNFRYITENEVTDPIDFASVDVAFISLKLIFPNLHHLLKPGALAVCLIKPQFEAGREKVGKKGVVRERSTHREVVETTCTRALESGFSILNLDFSPIRGPEGNIEYLILLKKSDAPRDCSGVDAAAMVEESHTVFAGGGTHENNHLTES